MQILSHSALQTLRIARQLAKYLDKGDILCLFGDLGSGKTVFIKGIAAGLGIAQDLVLSPTFVLLREYRGRIPLYHFDLYRLNDPREIAGLGYEEYLYDEGVAALEWADRLQGLVPAQYLGIDLVIKQETTRRIKFFASGRRYQELLGKFHEDTLR